MEELISVIVPIHNAEKYLNTCVESIISQVYHNLEIILIDDCSDDRSAEICDAYAAKDNRIRVVHRETKGGEGGAKARNTGLTYVTGDLIYFVDSDDYLESDMLAKMYQIMCQTESDCVVSSFHYVDDGGQELPWRTPQLDAYRPVYGKEAAQIFLTTLNIEGFSWNKLFRRKVFAEHEICFDEAMNSFVDMFGMFKAVLYSKKVSFYNAKPYYYRQHSSSCIHSMDKRKLDNYKRVLNQIAELAVEKDMEQEARFFYLYRMTLQLFDTIKLKKKYSKTDWDKIKQEYSWPEIYGKTVGKVYKILFQYLKEERIKTGIKLFLVWTCFK